MKGVHVQRVFTPEGTLTTENCCFESADQKPASSEPSMR